MMCKRLARQKMHIVQEKWPRLLAQPNQGFFAVDSKRARECISWAALRRFNET
jgi:hypothetical protein